MRKSVNTKQMYLLFIRQVSDRKGGGKPALGPAYEILADTRVYLRKHEGHGLATLTKSTNMPVATTHLPYLISERDVQDV